MKIGILGTGKIVEDLMRARERLPFSYVALLSTPRSREKAAAMCERYGLDRCYVDYEELLADSVDTVYVALPNHLHGEYARKALLHDKHVILEKPAVADGEELRELALLARERKKMLLEAVTVYYLPAYRALRQELGRIGEVKIASFNYSQYSSRYDAFCRGEVLPAFDPKCAGGALMDLNVYNIHALLGLFGEPERIHYEANLERGIDTSGILTLDFGRFKACAIGAKDCRVPLASDIGGKGDSQAPADSAAQGAKNGAAQEARVCQAPVSATIQGTKGCLVIPTPINRMDAYDLYLNDGEEKHYRAEENVHRMVYEFLEFDRMIREEDWEKEEAMLRLSLSVSGILDEARRQCGTLK